MKKKGISILLAVMLMAVSTSISYGASYQLADLQGSFGNLFKAWNTYIYKYLQNNNRQEDNNQQQNKPQNPDNNSGNINQGKATEILNLVNKERSKAGLANLKLDSQLNRLAQLKAEDMAKNGYFSHNSPTYGSAFDMMKQYGVSYKTAGENIAKGQKSSQSVMTAWMNSSGHKANILGSGYTKLGVGYAVDAKGNTYWVQMFVG